MRYYAIRDPENGLLVSIGRSATEVKSRFLLIKLTDQKWAYYFKLGYRIIKITV